MATPYFSEVKYLGGASVDFIEVAVDAGTDVSNFNVTVYNQNGAVRTTNPLGTKVATINGKDIYVIDTATSATFDGLHKKGAISLDDNGTVQSFISFDDGNPVTANGGAANGLTSTQVGAAGAGSSLETTDGGASYYTQNTPNTGTIPCFITGTMIMTATGEKPIETLGAGDRVITRDHGLQAIRWIGRKEITADIAMAQNFAPVCIRAHSFGHGLPETDLYVSPNHRILVRDANCTLLFDSNEVLSAAKFLVDGASVFRSNRMSGFAYYHMLFDQHEIVTSNGMPTESFHPGQMGLDGFDAPVRNEVFALFPELRSDAGAYGQTSRPDLRQYESTILSDLLTSARTKRAKSEAERIVPLSQNRRGVGIASRWDLCA